MYRYKLCISSYYTLFLVRHVKKIQRSCKCNVIFYLRYMDALPICMSTNHMHVQCPRRAEGIGYPESGVTDNCE